MPLPVRSSVCLLCRTRTTIPPLPSVLPTSWQTTRSMATLRTRRKASRMALSPNAGRSSLKSAKPDRDWRGPFSGMNQTTAPRVGGAAPRARSAAAQKRSGEDDQPDKKKESPLYKALKMQTMLAPIGYGRRTAIKSKIASITSFDNFPLLPAVRQSIFSRRSRVSPMPLRRRSNVLRYHNSWTRDLETRRKQRRRRLASPSTTSTFSRRKRARERRWPTCFR